MGYVELVVRREGRFLRWYARKRLHDQHRSDPTFRSMFLDEARLAGLIHHPNAVGVLDVGADQEGPFFIMELVEGVPLSRMIGEATAAARPIPLQVAIRVCMDAARGLHAAHEVRAEDGTVLRLVHRDVSPQNILVGFDGTVRVTDFGIAKALGNSTRTSAGVLKGNMGYLAPEQLRFEEPDRRSDLFSLGVTLYEMLSGQRLYPNTAGFDGTRRILSEPAPDIGDARSDVPAELCELLFELLAKDRESRPATAAEVASRLEGILAPLIGEEGSVTLADYMDQHFGLVRQEQRANLAAHLVRVEAEAAAALAETPSASAPAAASGQSRAARATSVGRRRQTYLAALAAAVGVIAVAWSAVHRRDVASPSPVLVATPIAPSLAPSPSEVGPIAVAPPPSGPAAAPAASTRPDAVRAAAKPHRRAASRSARRALPADQNESRTATTTKHRGSALSVPLFEHWQ